MTTQINAAVVRRYKTYSRLAGIISIAVGCLVIIGWIFNLPVLTSIRPELTSMKANTALAFMLCGIALVTLDRKSLRWVMWITASAAAVLAALTLLEYLFNWNLGLDRWLTQVLNPTANADRMSPITAFNFLMLGLGLLLLYSRRNKLAQVLALTAGFLGLLSLVGYVYGVQALYQIRGSSSTSLPSAMTFIVFSLGLLLAQPESGLISILSDDGAGGMLARRLLPTVIITPIIFGWLCLQGQRAGSYDTETGLSLFALSNSVFFTLVIGWFAYRLHHADTERLAAERALSKREEHYRALVENAPDTILTIDRDHRVRFINRAPMETVESLTGRSVYDFVYPEWHESYREILNRVFERGSTERLEVKAVRPGGNFVWSSLRFAPILEKGKITEVVVISTDISEQQQAEEARKISENQYQQLFEGSSLSTFVMDMETETFRAVNEAAIRQYGYTRDEFLKMKVREIRPPEAAAEINNRKARLLRGEWTFGVPIPSRHRKKDGTLFYVEIVTNMLNDGHHDLLLFTAQDVTERREADEAIRASEKHFSTVFQSVPVAIDISTVREGRILNVNRQFLEVMGYKANEVTQGLVGDIGIWSPPEQRDRLVHELSQKGSVRGAEGYWKTRSGEIRTMLISIEPISIGGEACLLVIAQDITERKRTEEALRASEEQYRELFEANPHPMVVIDLDTQTFLDVNDAALEKYGYTREEFIGMHGLKLRVPEDTADVPEHVRQIQQGDRDFIQSGVTRLVRKDGLILFAEVTSHRLTYQGRNAILSTTYDLTERLRAEEALRASEEQYRQLFEANPHPMFVADLETSAFLAVNEAAIAKYGYSRGEFLNMTTDDLRLPEDKASAAELIERYQRDNLRYLPLGVRRHIKKDGSLLFVELIINRLTYGEHNAVVGASYDLTERLKAEDALRRSEELFSTIFQSVPVAVDISTIHEGRLLNVNRQFLELTGYEADEVLDHTVEEIGLWQPATRRETLLQAIETKGFISGAESQWKTKSGKRVDVLVSVVPIEINGQACILAIGLDITERKQTERIRLEVYRERESLEVRERFISTMSHEFRTPLAVILGAKESLEHYYDRLKPERRAEHFKNIDQQIQYLTTMLEEILTLSRKHSGKSKFNPSRMNLAEACRKLFEQVQLTDTRQHEFVWRDDGQVGEMQSDFILLQHILINLLSNAIKYAPDGGKVTLAMSREGQTAVIRVSDQGIGIPAEDQKHLFEPFHRAANTKGIKGTGLGLTIVKESVEEHGGTIAFETAEGAGTTFIIRLPINAGGS